jgi:HJR/Mrr/RecB family endonuclease
MFIGSKLKSKGVNEMDDLCYIHNIKLKEKLNEQGNRIIPYCPVCYCLTLYEDLSAKEYQEYVARKVKQNETEMKSKGEKFPIWGYFLFLPSFLIVLLIGGIGGLLIFLGAMLIPLFLIVLFAILYEKISENKNKNIECNEEFIPLTFDQVVREQSEKILILQKEVEDYKEKLKTLFLFELMPLEEIDGMTGHDFEYYFANLLEKMGYTEVMVTPKSSDFGVDIIATDRYNRKVAVQCKRYSWNNSVGNEAVYALFTGANYYKCKRFIVVTSSKFTENARILAKEIGVELWDRTRLEKEILTSEHIPFKMFLSQFYMEPEINYYLCIDDSSYY